MHLHPTYVICVLPGLALFALLILPFWQNATLPEGNWFGGQRGKWLAFWSSFFGGLITIVTIVLSEKSRIATGSGATDILTRGVLPSGALVFLYFLSYRILTFRLKYTRAETVMAGFIFTITVLLTLTASGIWFRGPGMQLGFFF